MKIGKFVSIEENEGIVYLTLERPSKGNALNEQMLLSLIKAISYVNSGGYDLVLKGKGNHFCAGADLEEMSRMEIGQAAYFSTLGQLVFKLLANMNQLTIANIHGMTLGGGLELALACKVIVAKSGTKVGFPEKNFGIKPGFHDLSFFDQEVFPEKLWRELVENGRPIPAEEALNGRLIHSIDDSEIDFEWIRALRRNYSPVILSRETEDFHQIHRFAALFGSDFMDGSVVRKMLKFLDSRKK